MMVQNETLKTLSLSPFIVNETINDNNQGPNVDFFHKNISFSLHTDYMSLKELMYKFKGYTGNFFSALHLNIRSLSKKFESFKEF